GGRRAGVLLAGTATVLRLGDFSAGNPPFPVIARRRDQPTDRAVSGLHREVRQGPYGDREPGGTPSVRYTGRSAGFTDSARIASRSDARWPAAQAELRNIAGLWRESALLDRGRHGVDCAISEYSPDVCAGKG